MTCPWCHRAGGLQLIGVLGNRAHLRCRLCGGDCSTHAENITEDDEV